MPNDPNFQSGSLNFSEAVYNSENSSVPGVSYDVQIQVFNSSHLGSVPVMSSLYSSDTSFMPCCSEITTRTRIEP